MIEKNCLYCGKTFSSEPAHKRKFCSVACSSKGQNLKSKRWTKNEEDYIVANYATQKSADIAKHLSRTKTAVDLHIFYVLKLRKKGYSQSILCDYCGKKFTRPPSLINKTWGNFCNRKCRGKWISEHINGEQHPNWQGGSLPHYRGAWRAVQREARHKAKGYCQICGVSIVELGRKLDVHHIIPVRQFLMPNMAHYARNVICLCRSCHIKAHRPS